MFSRTYRAVFILMVCVFAANIALSQDPAKAYKIDQYDPKTDDPVVFEQKTKTFLIILKNAKSTDIGYVNLYSTEPLADKMKALSDGIAPARLVFLQPGIRPRILKENIEFWIVPDGAEPPFPALCGLCDCPSIDIVGKNEFELADLLLSYEVKLSGSAEIKYSWKVIGGEIIKGQNTPSIQVRPDRITDVTATVDIGGLDPSCNCQVEVSQTTVRKP
jgi:hypothetical protein